MKQLTSKKIKAFPYIILYSYSTVFIIMLFLSLFTNGPRELRDASNVYLANLFSQFRNPYIPSKDFIQNVNVYTPLNMLIASFIHIITKIRLYTIFYCLDFVYILLSAVLLAKFIYKHVNSHFLSLLVFAASLTLGWRLGFISTIPDHLGMYITKVVSYCNPY